MVELPVELCTDAYEVTVDVAVVIYTLAGWFHIHIRMTLAAE